MKKETFGQRLRRLRMCRNISQDQMAEALNTTRQTVSNWENDKCAIDNFALKDIRNLLQVSWEELMEAPSEMKTQPTVSFSNTMNMGDYFKRYGFAGLNIHTDIANLSKAGDYIITADDVKVATKFSITPVGVIAIAKEAKELGMVVLHIGFGDLRVRFETDEQAEMFAKMVIGFCTRDYEHGPRMALVEQKYVNEYRQAVDEILDEGIREVFGLEGDTVQVLADKTGPMGYAQDVESAKKLAGELGLKQYTIFEDKLK